MQSVFFQNVFLQVCLAYASSKLCELIPKKKVQVCKTKFFLFLLSTPLSLSADPTTLPAHHIFHFQILISLPSENKQKISSIQIIYKKVPFNSQLYITRRLQYADLSSGIFAFEGSIYSVILRIFALNPHFWLNWHTSAD